MTTLFSGDRHDGFAPFALPEKTEGTRPAGQVGFTDPDGREWSVLVQRAPVVTVDGGVGGSMTLWLTLADRVEGKTRRAGSKPVVATRHELTIEPTDLSEEYTLIKAIEDTVVAYWGFVKTAPSIAADTADQMAALGLDDTPAPPSPPPIRELDQQ